MSKLQKNRVLERIELSLPANAAYVSTARLTASSIASRLEFDFDEVEDIKAAVSEACTYILRKTHGGSAQLFRLVFSLGAGYIEIALHCDDAVDNTSPEEAMSELMMKALMDTAQVDCTDRHIDMHLTKTHKAMDL